MKPSGKRLSILTPDEIEEIYGLLKFSHEDRLIYFSFNHAEKEMVSHANFGRLKGLILQRYQTGHKILTNLSGVFFSLYQFRCP